MGETEGVGETVGVGVGVALCVGVGMGVELTLAKFISSLTPLPLSVT